MIWRIYAGIGRFLHLLATPLLRHYTARRVRAVVLNDRCEILLVRSWFGYQRWSLPGGGLRPGELPATAASREVQEETGVPVDARDLRLLGEFLNADSRAPFIVVCLEAHIKDWPACIVFRRRFEILEAAWFSLEQLPAARSQVIDRALQLLGR